ncbi:MAG TPA: ABC transporter permease, partial [Terriglobales bacterium]
MGSLLLDLRYSIRLLRRAPGFAAVAILTLALGLGANIAIFSIASPMLLQPLPFPHSERMVEVVHYYHGAMQNGLKADEAIQIDHLQQVFSADAIVDVASNANLYAHGVPVKVNAMRVSHGFFGVYDVAPALGRAFNAADDVPGTGRTAVLSNALWRSEFGARPNVVGETFQVDGAPYTVIGVMPAGFSDLEEGPGGFQATSLWTAMQPTVASLEELGPNLDLLGRLRPRLSMAQAQSAMDVMKADYNRSHPKSRMTWGVRSFHEAVVGDSSSALWLLLAAVGMVLLIACANIANLLLSRSTGRAREMAIRAAVGASQARVARQLLTESLVLSFLGAAGGALFAWVAIPWLHHITPETFALPITAGWNAWTLAFIIGLALFTGVVFGFAPALHARKLDLQAHLKESAAAAAAPGAGRVRGSLIVAEVALAFVLLAAAGMFIASLMKLDAVQPGFQTAGVMTAQTALTGAWQASDAATTRFTGSVLDRLRATPGVVAAASITGLPLLRAMNYSVEVTGNPDSGNYSIEWRAVSPGFFDTLRIPMAAGRDFNAGDSAAAPKVAIVSQGFARQFWPRQSPLGNTAFLPDPVPGGKEGTMYQIVGV